MSNKAQLIFDFKKGNCVPDFFFRVLQKVALFCCALFYFFLRGFFLWTFSFFEGHHLLYFTVVLLKQLTGLLKLLWVPCQPKVYMFNSKFRGKFFHFVVPFFSKQKHGGFILSPLTALYFFLWAFPSFFWSVKGAFFRCPFLALFLVRFMWHSLTATVEKKSHIVFEYYQKKGCALSSSIKLSLKINFRKRNSWLPWTMVQNPWWKVTGSPTDQYGDREARSLMCRFWLSKGRFPSTLTDLFIRAKRGIGIVCSHK